MQLSAAVVNSTVTAVKYRDTQHIVQPVFTPTLLFLPSLFSLSIFTFPTSVDFSGTTAELLSRATFRTQSSPFGGLLGLYKNSLSVTTVYS